jgi:hydrogenase/urease accessory protein HupE
VKQPHYSVIAALVLLSTATPASAHNVVGVGGIYGALLHPLLVPAHVLAIVALGLLASQQGPAHGRGLVALFGLSLMAGIGAIVLAFAADDPDLALLAVAALAGIGVAIAYPLPMLVTGPLAAVAGIAVMLDSVPQEISMLATLMALMGTAIVAVAMMAAVMALALRLKHGWPAIAVRVVGSWIAASAILVLALRLTR